jgi:hypothetical protein
LPVEVLRLLSKGLHSLLDLKMSLNLPKEHTPRARLWATSIHESPRRGLLSILPELRGERESPRLFTKGFYKYSVLSASPDVPNHHLNLLLAQRFIFCLRDSLEPLGGFAVWAFPCELGADFASSNALSSVVQFVILAIASV